MFIIKCTVFWGVSDIISCYSKLMRNNLANHLWVKSRARYCSLHLWFVLTCKLQLYIELLRKIVTTFQKKIGNEVGTSGDFFFFFSSSLSNCNCHIVLSENKCQGYFLFLRERKNGNVWIHITTDWVWANTSN